MTEKHVIIIGGGLAGLSAGCYARVNGFRVTIVEHNLALGGLCTAWSRGPYTIDGCIHWLTGGPFDQLYTELGILPKLGCHTLQTFVSYRDARTGTRVDVTRDLEALAKDLLRLGPEDAEEIGRVIAGAASIAQVRPPLDHPPELATLRESLTSLWEMRGELSTLTHFRKPVGVWAAEHLKSPALRRFFSGLFGSEMPTLFLLMTLGYLAKGWLSRPDGGSGRFRDALIDSYRSRGGTQRTHTTVDEVLVEGGRATGVRLSDGSLLHGDVVISTSSAPETVLRLLGGRYAADELTSRLERWKQFNPIVLVSFGVSTPLAEVPASLLIDGIEPLWIGNYANERLYLRIYNDDPGFAPPGHTVVQALLNTDYEWWATRGSDYNSAKDQIAGLALNRLERELPALIGAVRTVDVSTPLTYWNMARSWHGAYEGWLPSVDAMLHHVSKQLPGLAGFYMAGQWVEPGGGVPMAIMSGRQVVQLLCKSEGRVFEPSKR